jgi:MFS family permease
MLGPKDFLLGGISPMLLAMGAFSLAWLLTRRAGVAWPAGVLAGYLGGTIAVDAGGAGLIAAVKQMASPHDAHQWTWMIAVAAAIPAIIASLLGERRAWRWLLIAPLAVAAPLWLMWGGKYLPSAEIRASGFASDAWGVGEAAVVIGVVAVAMLLAWRLWEASDQADQPRARGLLAAIVLSCTAAVAGLSGSFVYAQAIGVLAASVGGCFLAALLWRVKAGPEAAAGPIIVLAGSLLLLATHYSKLDLLHAAGLWAAIAFSSACLPNRVGLNEHARVALRCGLCLVPLTLVLGHAAYKFAESQRQQQEEAASNPYLNM